MSELDKIKNRIKGLKQNKNKTEEEIDAMAKEVYDKQSILDSLSFCINDEERTWAKTLLEKYLEEKTFENFSERDTLRTLIDNEILGERIKKTLSNEYNKENPSLPIDLMEQLRDITKQSTELKETLGLIKDDKQIQDWEIFWNQLKKKCLDYVKTHKGEFIHKCPHCGEIFRSVLRMNDREVQKVPYFKGTKIYNKTTFKLYHEQKITIQEASEILGVSPSYIELMYNELFLKELKEEESKDKDVR